MMDTALKEVTRAAKLVSLPEVYLRLRSILDDPDFAMAEVAVVISQDPAITLRLLQLANSSLYGFSAEIETVSRAITLLGTQQVHDLVLATAVARTFEGMSTDIIDMARFWRRSVYCAVASRHLSSLCGVVDKERYFIAGILHDIGHLIMYQAIPDLSQRAILRTRECGEPLYTVERELIGFDSARVGADLMHQWLLPESLCEITLFHVEPDKAETFPLDTALVHLGSLLAKSNDNEGQFNEGHLSADPSVWSNTMLSPGDCTALEGHIEEDVQEVMNCMFSRTK